MTESFVNNCIPVLGASGTGATTLAAFHSALVALDVGHYNLIRLSSVVPPGIRIDASGDTGPPAGDWGDRMYCVYAEQRTSTPGQEAWSGIGWVHRLGDGGGGLMVEHEGESRAFVADSIRASLGDMVGHHDGEFSAPQLVVKGVQCTEEPVCSLVIAMFAVEPWSTTR